MISWNRVNELRDEVGAEDFQEVVDLFLEEVEEVIVRLRHNPDPDAYEADLHFLKGSALNLGFEALCQLCSQGEKMARDGNSGAVDLAAVLSVYEQSRQEFVGGYQKPRTAA